MPPTQSTGFEESRASYLMELPIDQEQMLTDSVRFGPGIAEVSNHRYKYLNAGTVALGFGVGSSGILCLLFFLAAMC